MKKLIILLLLFGLFIGGLWLFKITFLCQNGKGEIKNFEIKEGEGVNQISQNLKAQGLIESNFVFETYIWLTKAENKILAGEHEINDKWSIKRLVNVLVSGNALENEKNIKIIEGWNLRDLANYLVKEEIIKEREELYDLVGYPGVDYNLNTNLSKPKDYSADYEFLAEKPKNLSLEGYLFPDTYRVYKDAKLEDVIKKMLDNFDKKIDSDMLGEIDNQGKKLYDILTLASIIEKEAKTLEDKKRVAGVYYNRLDIGMALQADPTVNYITEKVTDRPSYEDIEIDSLFNTYKYPGLPPGPICNPGLDSIIAAIYPEENNYMYFLNTQEGKMIFSKTLEEHVRNREKYFINN